MKQVKLGSLKDGAKFKVSKRSTGLTYKVVAKAKGFVIYTSVSSEYSSAKKAGVKVWVKA